jgi:hypothetical protein
MTRLTLLSLLALALLASTAHADPAALEVKNINLGNVTSPEPFSVTITNRSAEPVQLLGATIGGTGGVKKQNVDFQGLSGDCAEDFRPISLPPDQSCSLDFVAISVGHGPAEAILCVNTQFCATIRAHGSG